MSVKYTLPYRDDADEAWRIDISTAAYSGEPIVVKGISRQAAVINWVTETDDPYAPIVKSNCIISIRSQGQIDILELQEANDKDFLVQQYKGSELKWVGYLISDGIERTFQAPPYDITITATDGLSFLEKTQYTHANLHGTDGNNSRCPINYVRQILFATENIGLPLPIHWVNSLECTAYTGEDVWAGSVQWGNVPSEAWSYYTETGEVRTKTCEYILEGLLKAYQSRIYQCDGKWVIRRVNDVVSGVFINKSIPANLGDLVITEETIDIRKVIGSTGYGFMREDQILTVKKAIGRAKVTYEATINENILPNGNQDNWIPSSGSIMFWNVYTSNPGTPALLTQHDPINDRSGYATEIDATGLDGGFYTLYTDFISALPVDSDILLKKITFGFLFLPIEGYAVDGSGFIDWSTQPLLVSVIYYNTGTLSYWYLNEYGTWQPAPIEIPIVIEGLKLNDIASVNFNKNATILVPNPDPAHGTIRVEFRVKADQHFVLDNIYINTEQSYDVYESIYNEDTTSSDERTLEISSAVSGYMVSNLMTNFERSDNERYFTDGVYTGDLTGLTANAIMKFMYKSSIIYNGTINTRGKSWAYDEIYSIDTLNDKYFLPLNATYNTETCEVYLTAIECRNDDIDLEEKHYGSNDEQLSN